MRTDDLIQNLSDDLEPKEPLNSLGLAFALWFGLTLLSLVLQVWRHGLRADFAPMLSHPTYGLEIGMSLALAVVSGIAALRSRIPGHRIGWPAVCGLLGFWVLTLLVHGWSMTHDMSFDFHREAACFASIIAYSIAPLILLYLEAKKGASTTPRTTMAVATIGSAAAAAAFLAAACPGDAPLHLLIGHALPLFVMTLLLLPWARRLLAWNDR